MVYILERSYQGTERSGIRLSGDKKALSLLATSCRGTRKVALFDERTFEENKTQKITTEIKLKKMKKIL